MYQTNYSVQSNQSHREHGWLRMDAPAIGGRQTTWVNFKMPSHYSEWGICWQTRFVSWSRALIARIRS